ncbi:MAG: RsmE family RNA methyltransferase, partial [Bradymonadaceae bacterium]
TSRSVVEIPAGKVESRLERWHKIAASAARQSQRRLVPEITPQRSLRDAIEDRAEIFQVVPHPGDDARSLTQHLSELSQLYPPYSLAIWIGPEGGFEPDEIKILRQANVAPVHLGPRILRSETAGIIAVSLIQATLGDMR